MPTAAKFLIDEVITKGRRELLPLLAGAIGVAILIEAATAFTLSQVLGVAAQRRITDVRKAVQSHLTRLPIRFFDSTQTGALIPRIMSDAEGIRNLIGSGLVQLAGSVITALVALAILFYLNWWITSINIVILAAFAVLVTRAFKSLRPLYGERARATSRLSGRLAESLSGIRVVKAYVAERHETRVFARGAHALFRLTQRAMTGMAANLAVGTLAVVTIEAVTIILGTLAVLRGTMSVGDLFMTIALLRMLADPIYMLASVGTQIAEAFAGLDRIAEIRQMPTEDQEDMHRASLPTVDGAIRFEDVSFEYTPGVPVLKNVSFEMPAGSTTALVGSSGSGKSTLISLLMTFNQPVSGKVLVDGHDLAQVRLRDYRAQLGVVLQENFMFDGSILDNIRFSRPLATLEDVQEVSRIAHCDEFIERFPNGYDTVVGERGVKLSGGQRQRVAIARAILADPRILILDEATSSLDSEVEAMIQDGLWNLRRGRTTVVIAHRLSTIQTADQILVIEAGEIVERGTHAELLASDGRYRHLYDVQYRLERNRFVNPGEDFTPDPPKIRRPSPVLADTCIP